MPPAPRWSIEAFLEGEEASFFALCDGTHAIPFGTAQDHKRVFDGDEGPNTGGMGAYSPAAVMTPEMQARVMREIIEPTLAGMRARGTPYTGILYAGLMLTEDGPQLIEYNARFGDPETQVLLPRLKSDLVIALLAACDGVLDSDLPAMVGRGSAHRRHGGEGLSRRGREGIGDQGHRQGGSDGRRHRLPCRHEAGRRRILANGGRVLNVTALGRTISEAKERAYEAVDAIDWPEGFCRRDIGWRAVEREQPETPYVASDDVTEVALFSVVLSFFPIRAFHFRCKDASFLRAFSLQPASGAP